jgi:hypothetical protein
MTLRLKGAAMTQILHYVGLICLAASLLMRILPTPDEIGWKPYAVLYGIVRRASLNLPAPSNTGALDSPAPSPADSPSGEKG